LGTARDFPDPFWKPELRLGPATRLSAIFQARAWLGTAVAMSDENERATPNPTPNHEPDFEPDFDMEKLKK